MSYLFSGALEQAIDAVGKSVDLSSSFALAHLGQGLVRLYAGDAAGAIEPLERGLRLNPFDPQNFLWFRTLGLAQYFAGGPVKGLAAATKALQVRPDWRPAIEAMILCHVALGQIDDAHRCAERAVALAPPDSDVLEQLKIHNPNWATHIASILRDLAWRRVDRSFVPTRRDRGEPVLQLVEGVPRSRQEAAGGRYRPCHH